MIEHLAWPSVVAVLGLVGMLVFRSPIGRLLDRTRKVGKSGLETLENPQLPAPAEKPDPLADFMAAYDNQFLREQENAILEDIKKRGLVEAAQAQRVLVRSLAGTQILLLFERAQNLIWASQIAALMYLNSRGGEVPVEEVRPFFTDASGRYPDLYKEYAFEAWLRFLESYFLIRRSPGMVELTIAGREFLKWRIDAGRAGPFHG